MIIDTIGQLSSLYRRCDVALVGGSFLEGAGHNPLEPAAAGKPIIFGPHMSSFQQEALDLEAAGAAIGSPPGLLGTALRRFLSDREGARRAGLAGLAALAGRNPVGQDLAKIILHSLDDPLRKN
jgi:3-deoxy-D-manno-octulosonic-acid transferase